jgi:VWFA-related protein
MVKTKHWTAACFALFCIFSAIPWASGQQRPMPGTLDPEKARPAPGQAKPAAPAAPVPQVEGPTIRTTVQVVLVPTTVTDREGRVVNGLQPQDFRLLDNDKPQEINRDVAFLPLSMVICIQRSNNVENVLPKIRKMGNVLRDLLIGQDGEAAIVSFDHRIETLADFTNDPDKINEAMAKIRPGGSNSRLNDAVQHAVRMLRNKRDRRKVILMISETLDRSSEAKPREVATELQIHNIDFYTLNISRLVTSLTAKPEVPRPDPFPPGARPRPGIAPMDPTTTAQLTGTQGQGGDLVPVIIEMFRAVKAIFIRNPAELYTQFTGGREYSFITQADLEAAIGKIGEEIRSQYILSYTPNNKLEGGFHKIEVQVLRPNLKVRTRPGYWMAAVPE